MKLFLSARTQNNTTWAHTEMRITRNDLLDGVNPKLLELCEELGKELTHDINEIHAWKFSSAPMILRKLCDWSGGDEDWMVLVQKEFEYIPSWLEHMDSMASPDVYILNSCVIYIGSHA